MRLWHYELIPYLPRRQLLSQWRELNSIFVKQDKNRLINYIYEYDKIDLKTYSDMVIAEMIKRGYKVNKLDNYKTYFKDTFGNCYKIFVNHHNKRYLLQCFYNLQEKYEKGFDISDDEFEKLEKFIINRIGDARLYDLLLFV